jgi:hypothetical protein
MSRPKDLANNLVLPTILFAALGGMSWAVRGTRGFGGGAGCIFAGVLWGVAWWYLARSTSQPPRRRYASGWIVVALVMGMAISGERGWMQWSHFFSGKLYTDHANGQFVPISRAYGFLWLFLAGMPWAGISACFVAWSGSLRETRIWHWLGRIAIGLACGTLLGLLLVKYPQFFLPLYSSISDKYQDLQANPDLRRVIEDCRLAMVHVGFYLGFLLFELLRRDWKNAGLIATVGLLNGIGWAALQNWKWAPEVFEDMQFAWWRCWESSGGISIGLAFGIAYYLFNGKMPEAERLQVGARRSLLGPNFEWFLVFGTLASLLAVYLDELVGPRDSVGLTRLELPEQIAPALVAHFNAWGSWYCAAAIAFATLYYFAYRGTTVDGAREKRGWVGWLTRVEWGAALISLGFIIPLFADLRLREWLYRLLGWELPQDSQLPEISDELIWFRLACVALVSLAGVAWYFARRKAFEQERSVNTPVTGDPNLERLGVYLGILAGLCLSIYNGTNGFFKVYGDSAENGWLWNYVGPVYFLLLLGVLSWILIRPLPRNFRGDLHPRAYGLVWLVLLVQNAIAQVVTGPPYVWKELAFSLYYLLLLTISGLIVFHLHTLRTLPSAPQKSKPAPARG